MKRDAGSSARGHRALASFSDPSFRSRVVRSFVPPRARPSADRASNANANANANAKLCVHIVPRGVFFFKIGIFGCRTTTERDDDDDDDGASASARDDETNEQERSDARDDERW